MSRERAKAQNGEQAGLELLNKGHYKNEDKEPLEEAVNAIEFLKIEVKLIWNKASLPWLKRAGRNDQGRARPIKTWPPTFF